MPRLPRSTNSANSSANDEKVVKPPSRPTPSNSRHVSPPLPCRAIQPISSPMQKEPRTLAVKVAQGKAVAAIGPIAASHSRPVISRSHDPTPPPPSTSSEAVVNVGGALIADALAQDARQANWRGKARPIAGCL